MCVCVRARVRARVYVCARVSQLDFGAQGRALYGPIPVKAETFRGL